MSLDLVQIWGSNVSFDEGIFADAAIYLVGSLPRSAPRKMYRSITKIPITTTEGSGIACSRNISANIFAEGFAYPQLSTP